MKVRLNLATSPLENNRRFLLGTVLLGGAALVAFGFLSTSFFRAWNANRALRNEVSSLDRDLRNFRDQRAALDSFFQQPDTKRIMDRAAFLNGLIDQRTFPWTRMFTDLERLLPEGVRVVSIAPRLAGARVEIKFTIGAQNDEVKLKFLETLEKAPEFERLQVVSESRPTRFEEGDRVLVELAAVYATTDLPAPPPAEKPKAERKRESSE
jgi:Tfp pilus assembly protein PilN